MPWIKTNETEKYALPMAWLMLDEEYIEMLIKLRKETTKEMEEFLGYQKMMDESIKELIRIEKDKTDPEEKLIYQDWITIDEGFRKFFKECAKEEQKRIKAINYFLGEITGNNRKKMSEELAPYLDAVHGILYNH